MPNPINIFIAYSRKDKEYLDELLLALKVLQRTEGKELQIWCDQEIDAGKEWKKEIEQELESADIFLLMVSRYFIASEFCVSIEMKRAIERHEENTTRVIPLIIRQCNWHLIEDLAKLQAPVQGRPIKGNEAIEDELYTGIVDEVYGVLQDIKTKRELTRLQAEEDAYWQKVTTLNRIQNYEEYLETYPNGKYISLAEQGIQAIKTKQEQERLAQLQRKETAFWNDTIEVNTFVAYDKYLLQYPNGKYATEALEAKQLINQRALEAARAKDNGFWKEVKATNTKESYQDYFNQYPDGLHYNEAKRGLQRLIILLPEMVFVEGGKDTHGNTIKDFWIGKYPVMNEEYAFS